MTKRLFLGAVFLMCMMGAIGCSSTGSEGSSGGMTADGGCLLGFAERMDELLTAALAAEITGKDVSEAKYRYANKMRDSDYHSLSYAWKSNSRIQSVKVGGNSMELPASDLIELSGIKKTEQEAFRASIRNPTDEELAEGKKRMEELLSGKSDNESVNKRLEQLKEMGVDPETLLGMSDAITGSAGHAAQRFSEVTEVGDIAAWNSVNRRLHVWADGTEFSVSVVLSDDEATNRSKSIELAEEILKKCR